MSIKFCEPINTGAVCPTREINLRAVKPVADTSSVTFARISNTVDSQSIRAVFWWINKLYGSGDAVSPLSESNLRTEVPIEIGGGGSITPLGAAAGPI